MIKSKNDMIKMIAIKTKQRVYISDNLENSSYHNSYLQRYTFDGEVPIKTFKNDWFEISSLPNLVQIKTQDEKVNVRYELKELHYNTGLPKVVTPDQVGEDGEYESVYGLYQKMYDTKAGELVSVEFQINVIEELDDFVITKKEFDCRHSLLDKIQVHPVLLSTRPCVLSKEESYKIVRNYIKANIDHRYAKFTSDYDFCLTVAKVIQHDPNAYQVNIGKRKPKYETRYQRTRTVTAYEVAPKSYQNYTVIDEFRGNNEEDLKAKIEKYLAEIMEVINKPYVECEHCKGMGVVLDEVQN